MKGRGHMALRVCSGSGGVRDFSSRGFGSEGIWAHGSESQGVCSSGGVRVRGLCRLAKRGHGGCVGGLRGGYYVSGSLGVKGAKRVGRERCHRACAGRSQGPSAALPFTGYEDVTAACAWVMREGVSQGKCSWEGGKSQGMYESVMRWLEATVTSTFHM